MGNYLNTIDGTLVNNSAAVHTMREADRERKRERESELMNLLLPSKPENVGWD